MKLPKPGRVQVGFSTANGALSWFIRTVTRSQASHSFLLYFSEQFGQHMVLEVQGRGFVQVPFEVWKTNNKLLALYEIEREESVIDNAMHLLGERLGDPYDTYSLIGFLLIYVLRVWNRNDLDDKEKLVCSEMVALFLRWTLVPMQEHIDSVIPRDLWRLAEDSESLSRTYSSSKAIGKLRKVCKHGECLLPPERDRS